MENRKKKILLNRKPISDDFQHFPFFNEMRDALRQASSHIKEIPAELEKLNQKYPKCLSVKYVEHIAENVETSHQLTNEKLDGIKREIVEIIKNTSNYREKIENLVQEIEHVCEDSSVLSAKLDCVTVLHQEVQKQKDQITSLLFDLHNIYRTLLQPKARKIISNSLNNLRKSKDDSFACLELGAYCGRIFLVGYSSLQIVSEDVQKLTDSKIDTSVVSQFYSS